MGVRAETAPLARAERRLARRLRLLALLFAAGAVGFVLRPDETVTGMDRVGSLVGLPTLMRTAVPVASDFWLPLAVANMAAGAVGAWYAGGDVRRRRPVVYPIVASAVSAAAAAILLFVRWAAAFAFLAAALVNLGIAIVLVSALRAAPPERQPA
jgi:hypothetical protein